jgi:tetratricopeptide (TPR) repeat protein
LGELSKVSGARRAERSWYAVERSRFSPQAKAGKRDSSYGWAFTGGRRVIATAGYYGQALKVVVWPYPLKLFYESTTRSFLLVTVGLQLVLLCAVLFELKQRRYGLLAGLAFFYIAMLPASRFIGLAGVIPEFAERYLYFPSIGLTLLLAYGLRFLGERSAFPAAMAPVLLLTLVMTPVCWARNAEWTDESILFENEYRRGGHGESAVHAVTTSRLQQRDYSGAAEICDRHFDLQWLSGKLSINCGWAYGALGRIHEAEQAFLFATSQRKGRILAHNNLASLYLRLGRREEALKHFELAIDAEPNAAVREFREGQKLLLLYPGQRTILLEARGHFEEALRLQPDLIPAQQQLESVTNRLESLE